MFGICGWLVGWWVGDKLINILDQIQWLELDDGGGFHHG